MAIPDYQSLMLPLLRRAAASEVRIPAIRESIADEFGMSAEDRTELLKSGTQRVLDNRLHWAKIYLSKAGLLITPTRGCFTATDEGKMLLRDNPSKLNNEALARYPSFVEFIKGRSASAVETKQDQTIVAVAGPIQATPEEEIESALSALTMSLRDDLIERLLQKSPAFFERAIVDLLIGMGYGGTRRDAAKELLGKPGDGGVDGVINADPLGLDRVYVQAKRYAKTISVGRPDVQAFVGSLVGFGSTKGVFVTTSTFTAQARDFVTRLPQRIVLIDGDRLADLMIEHCVGVRTERSIDVKKIDEDFFLEEI